MGRGAVAKLAAAANLAQDAHGDAQLPDGCLHLGVVQVGLGHELVQRVAELGVGEVGPLKGLDPREYGGGHRKHLVQPGIDAPEGGEQDHAGNRLPCRHMQREGGAHRVADQDDTAVVALEMRQRMFDGCHPVGVAPLGQFGDGVAKAGQEEPLGGPAFPVQQVADVAQLGGCAGKAVDEQGSVGGMLAAVFMTRPIERPMFGSLKCTQFDAHSIFPSLRGLNWQGRDGGLSCDGAATIHCAGHVPGFGAPVPASCPRRS